jgi:hypothetical protein
MERFEIELAKPTKALRESKGRTDGVVLARA